jgi:hypothetical protein
MRKLKLAIGLVLVGLGAYLSVFPLVVAELFDRPHATSTQLINLRATWGGTLLGIGAFIAWLPALRPWVRTLVGLLMWAMAGIGAARLLGFALDGDPDSRQLIWLVAEVVIVIACAAGLRVLARRAK